MKKIILFVLIISTTCSLSNAQQTVGIFLNSSTSYDGYTLFAPMGSDITYLIDNCGEMVHSWTASQSPGLTAYLGENGLLYHPGRSNGGSPVLEILDWDSNVVWSLATQTYGPTHHDIEILPNGNILMIVQDLRTPAEVSQVGGSFNNTLLSEKIIEIQPDFNTGGATLVWEWYAWDHLIQDVDAALPDYGVIANAPERIDINAYSIGNNGDWLHFNGVDYNAEFDQIVVSTPRFNEIWIIDHSTTTVEAAGSSGGNSGKGGDLLYRWGNPQMYGQGTAADQKLFFQHHPNWIPSSYPDGGKIIIFNNRAGTAVGELYSTVNIINPPIDNNGNYIYSGGAYGPVLINWTYQASPPADFSSQIISGAEQLPNGNVLICEGTSGRLFEVNRAMGTVWEYINPVGNNGPISQYSTPSGNHNVFRAIRYAPGYAGLAGRDLTPQGYIESGSNMSCTLYPSCAPMDLTLNFDNAPFQTSWEIQDASGAIVASSPAYSSGTIMTTESLCLPDGCYDLIVNDAIGNGMCPFRATASSGGTFVTPGTLIASGSTVATLGTVVTPGLCGNYSLQDASGNIIANGGGSFGTSQTNSFCITGGVPQFANDNMDYAPQIPNSTETNTLRLYPNPTDDILHIQFEGNTTTETQLNIVDMTGKIIYTETRAIFNSNIQLNVNDLNSGIYFVQIIDNEEIIAQKFVVK